MPALSRCTASPTNFWPTLAQVCEITDTVAMASKKHPGQRVSLDALCKRYEVDNSRRELHGALLDAQLLADVYLLMTGGQSGLDLSIVRSGEDSTGAGRLFAATDARPRRLEVADEDMRAHAARLDEIEKASGKRLAWG